MKLQQIPAPILRLVYAMQFVIAVIAVFVLWSEVGGQGHLDLMPWYLKLGLGIGAALAAVKATAAAVVREPAWNGGTLKWLGIMLALMVGCGMASYYYHVYEESDEEDAQDSQTSSLVEPGVKAMAIASQRGPAKSRLRAGLPAPQSSGG